MQIYLTSEQERQADANAINFGLPSEVLMKRAGRAICEEVVAAAEKLQVKKVLVVCGTGNNGGDGYVAARELLKHDLSVSVFCFEGELSTGCKREKKRYTGKFTRSVSADIIVDCIFGTGLNRKLQGDYASIVKKINASGAYVISADIPSGLNGDNGLVMGVAVKADLTVALGHAKLGCVLGDGAEYSGLITVKDIGVVSDGTAVKAAEERDIAKFYEKRKRNTNKGNYGKAYLVAGSEQYPGSATLAVSTALKSGCGYVYAVVPKSFKYALAAAYPQGIYLDSPSFDADAIAVGMGMGCTQETYNLVFSLLKSYRGKLIIDADGINALAQFGKDILKDTKAQVLLTPHIGEMSRLTGLSKEKILEAPVEVAQRFAAEYNVTVHLKNTVSVTCDGSSSVLSVRGTSALAKAGSGDMLSGLICGLAARGLSLADAAVCAQYTLGVCAEVCSDKVFEGAVTADDILKVMPFVMKDLSQKS